MVWYHDKYDCPMVDDHYHNYPMMKKITYLCVYDDYYPTLSISLLVGGLKHDRSFFHISWEFHFIQADELIFFRGVG